MTAFAADWLDLRREADRSARDTKIEKIFLDYLEGVREGSSPVRLVDIATGTGANLALLHDKLEGPQHWTLLDHDQDLLNEIRPPNTPSEITIVPQLADLSAQRSFAHFDGAHGIVTTAFLDLVSRNWVTRFVKAVTDGRQPFLATLTYNGEVSFSHPHRHDGVIMDAVNMHQKTDKGFGLALGPAAAQVCAQVFRDAGYEVHTAPSNWVLGNRYSSLLRDLIRGWAQAAVEIGIPKALADDWKQERLSLSQNSSAEVTVGHTDFVALPRD
ncbi:glycosyl transferase family 1 [Pseudovibrio sp. SPO723]|uniref:glycosyl transferase family 1 n=1 Tax=Nesiotobacter zosterae TaxID=392721 RepID=UPI0029C427AE|nr:glycosyl transferase family 1 [Pseudovibrio sp. SPO723]MDX5592237.1 glycosyl transferase family 1 [Pseudovibrio sp. SPO723]